MIYLSHMPIEADFAVNVCGNAMAPFFQDGDVVLFRSRTDVQEGEPALVEIDGEQTIKRVFHSSGRLVLVSENTAYPAMNLACSEVHILGVPVGLIRAFGDGAIITETTPPYARGGSSRPDL